MSRIIICEASEPLNYVPFSAEKSESVEEKVVNEEASSEAKGTCSPV